ncbi:MAG: hypothetical protein AB1483_04875 [Candidatus Zixiibacteriota bacterium]
MTRECYYCDEGIVHAGIKGILEQKSWPYVFCKTLALAGIYHSRGLLIDLREATPPASAPLAGCLPAALEHICESGFYKLALVVQSHSETYSWFDTAFNELAPRLRIFTGYQEAKNWLAAQHELSREDWQRENRNVTNVA